MSMDYKKAGVDIAAGDALVDWLKANQPPRWPHQERLVSGIGGFAALFRGGFPQMTSPCLVSCTDGVGTKVKLAAEFGRYQSVAQDLVAMCVNDLVCCGASPLFFLDYYACGKLELADAQKFLAGLQKACLESDCMLIGGETAEMPGVYSGKDFDCAGFAVGVVDEPKVLGSHRVQPGDVVIGISSSGFHSNGYSLLRKIFAEDLKRWVDVLLEPTALYVKLAHRLQTVAEIHAFAHITGGGMDNLLRVVPAGTHLQLKTWNLPAPFLEVKRRGKMSWRNLLETLNCGVGFAAVLNPQHAPEALESIRALGFQAWTLAEVRTSAGRESEWSFQESEFEAQL